MFGELEINDGDSVEDDFQGVDGTFSYTDKDICEVQNGEHSKSVCHKNWNSCGSL
jgi:hypothetical protein